MADDDLARRERQLRMLADASRDAVTVTTPGGRYTYASAAAGTVFGRAPEELIGRSVWELVHPDDLPRLEEARQAALAGTGDALIEFRLRLPDGAWRWVEAHGGPIRSSAGETEGLQMVTRDISERRAQAQALQETQELLDVAMSEAPIGKALIAPDRTTLRVNRALADLLGRTEEELMRMSWAELTHPDDVEADLELIASCMRGERDGYELEKRYLRPDGSVIQAQLYVALVRDAAGEPRVFVGQLLDVTAARAAEAQLRELADTDPLTGLLNRRRFQEELDRELARTARSGEPAVLLMLDVDCFKRVNDTYGHAAGDRVLRAIADALRARLRDTDAIARLGGDEFAAIVVGCDVAAGRVLAAELADLLAGLATELELADTGLSVAIGVGSIDAAGDRDAALAAADAAMYAVKQAGRG